MSDSIGELYAQHLLGNYATAPLNLVKGEGTRVWDDAGRSYLDFATGIAVNAIGHSHPTWVARLREQVGVLAHISNLYRNPLTPRLAEALSQRCGPGRAFFCNSGAEANEALLKLARLHGRRKSGQEGDCIGVVVAERAFHGRTFGGMSATPQDRIQAGYRPLLSGFSSAPLNDLAAWERAIDAKTTAAVLIESIQGEGGIFVADPEFLRGVERLCRERNVLLLIDEIQCGIGRSGKFFAYEFSGIRPDAIAMAKGLGGGFPIGCMWIAPPHHELFQPGSHGTTFGGNPLAAAAALAVIEVIDTEHLLDRVTGQSVVWHDQLRAAVAVRPDLVREVRGLGYMVGVALTVEPRPLVAALREQGLLAVPAGDNALRLLPPLTASAAELAEATAIFARVIKDWSVA